MLTVYTDTGQGQNIPHRLLCFIHIFLFSSTILSQIHSKQRLAKTGAALATRH
jgi:uncharacterized membrane protein YwaF